MQLSKGSQPMRLATARIPLEIGLLTSESELAAILALQRQSVQQLRRDRDQTDERAIVAWDVRRGCTGRSRSACTFSRRPRWPCDA